MHLGSSKEPPATPERSETLPLSAPGPTLHRITFRVARAARTTSIELEVPDRTPLRAALTRAGQAPEGCLVLEDDAPVPLDLPILRSGEFTVVPTFSGG